MTSKDSAAGGNRSSSEYFAWLLIAITLGLFIFNVVNNHFIGDDAYISFRYAAHMAEGHGLVWNVGDPPVEGYTNFLWVLMMAAGMKLGFLPELLSSAFGCASGSAILYLLAWFSGRDAMWRTPSAWVAPLLLASSRSFSAWCTGGLETQFFALLLFSGLITLVWEREQERLPLGSALLLGLAALTRPEGILVITIAFVFIAVESRKRGLRFLAFSGGIVAVHLLWRLYYYGAWLPNTFHAKVNGFWFEQGLAYLALFQQDYKVLCYAWLLLLPLLVSRRREHGLIASVVAIYLFYVVSVGGDRFEFRFLVHIFPLVYWLLAQGLWRLPTLLKSRPKLGHGAAWVLTVAIVGQHLLARAEPAVNFRNQVATLHRIKSMTAARVEQGKLLRQLVLEEVLPDDLRISVRGAGALPYHSQLYTLDYLGLSDKKIASSDIKV
ncbi:MAG: hypothetical protein HN348_15040, partial [Proteobacteria bacterium]|nr:hypothetical protein [Pseudomonadota bacterium]